MPSLLEPYLSRVDYLSDGNSIAYAITFAGSKPSTNELPYIKRTDVKVYDVVPATATSGEILTPVLYRWVDDYNLELFNPITAGHYVRIQRETFSQYNLTDYNSTSQITEEDLELSQRQLIFLAQESSDLAKATALLVASGNSTDITITPTNSVQFYKDNTPLGTAANTTKFRIKGDSVEATTPDTETVVYFVASSNVSVIAATVPSGGALANVTKADGLHINSLSLTGDTITLTVAATTGAGNGKPIVYVDDTEVVMSNPSSTTTYWEGTITLTVTSTTTIAIKEATSKTKSLAIVKAAAPTVNNIYMSGTYPNGQTEHAAGQNVTLTVTGTLPFNRIVISAGGALAAGEYNVPLGTSASVSIPVAVTGNTVTTKAVTLFVKTDTNAYSALYTSTDFGNTDGTHTLKCNDITPTNTISSIVYANGFSALKDNELATVTPTLANYTSVLWELIGDELTIITSPTFAGATQVARNNGDYNITAANLRLTAYRATNGTSIVTTTVVWIAHTTPTVAITLPATRLRSAPTGLHHTITLTASQRINTVSLSADIGSFFGAWTSVNNGVSWTRSLSIADTNFKGVGTFSNLSAVNLAGKPVTVITTGSNYVVGGFVQRTIQMAAWPNRESFIGTSVTDVTKLRVTNLSKGQSGSLNTSFVGNVGDGVDTFTITSPTGIYNANGNLIYNRDVFNAVSNTSGYDDFYEVEEIV